MGAGRKAAIFSHAQDMDGVASAAIMSRYLESQGKEVEVDFINYGTVKKDVGRMKELENTDIYVLDFHFDDMETFKDLDEVLERGNKVAYWGDHHPLTPELKTAHERYAALTDLISPSERCAAEIAKDRYAPTDPIAQKLAQYAHDQDFYEKEIDTANKVSDLISSNYDKQKLVSMMKQGETWNDELEETWQKYDDKRQEGYQKMDEKVKVFNYGDVSCAVSIKEPYLSGSDAGNHLLDKYNTDMIAVMSPSGVMSLRRSEDCTVDLGEVAQMFNGGGHAYAAGAKLDFKVKTDEAYARALETIDGRLTEYFG